MIHLDIYEKSSLLFALEDYEAKVNDDKIKTQSQINKNSDLDKKFIHKRLEVVHSLIKKLENYSPESDPLKNVDFWKRLELFVKDVKVNCHAGSEEKEMILKTCYTQLL